MKKSKQSDKQKQRGDVDSGKPKNAGLPWTEELKTEVASKYLSGTSIHKLASYFERTTGAIVSELTKQGVMISRQEDDFR